MMIFNDLSLYHVSSSYYETSNVTVFINQVSQYKPLLFKGSTIMLILALNLGMQLFVIAKFTQLVLKNHESS